jgi:hypothetical protein
MISPEEEMTLYYLLEDRLTGLDVSLMDTPSLARAWTDYLSPLGIRRESMGFVPEEGVYMSADPLNTTKYRLLIPWGVVEKILFVGLP